MNFRTKVEIPKQEFEIDHDTQIVLFGSCFSQNIGNKLSYYKFNVAPDAFGILYNPLSISNNINRLLHNKNFEEEDIVGLNGVYQSFMHHGDFSNIDKDICLKNIQDSFHQVSNIIPNTDVFFITFGTSYIFKLRDTGEVVANCHKYPANTFIRERLSVSEIVSEWSKVIDDILDLNPSAQFIFTVSPIRHWKDGAHENNISKAILHVSIDELKSKFSNSVSYFPAFEIMMDELRDYRFYSDDMVHPSPIAVEYIWKRFGDTYFSKKTNDINNEWERIKRSIDHKPINTNTDSYISFLNNTFTKLSNFNEKYPFINLNKEITNLTERINNEILNKKYS